MERVKQISIDILVDENVDGYDFAQRIANFLKTNSYKVLGADFKEDMTDVYKNEYGYKEDLSMKHKIDIKVLSYIADHNSNPLDFMYAIMHEANLTDEEALYYLSESFGYKYEDYELEEVIAKYREEHD